jgi:hypothetical protein
VFSNVTGDKIESGAEIAQLLGRQLVEPVQVRRAKAARPISSRIYQRR